MKASTDTVSRQAARRDSSATKHLPAMAVACALSAGWTAPNSATTGADHPAVDVDSNLWRIDATKQAENSNKPAG